ncbi:MAG: NUDIX domain-containing protein [Verrucomicrobiota bacterium]
MNDAIHILVRGVVIIDGHVLLAHAKDAANTFLPGGHVEVGESLAHALSRELAEELGCTCRIAKYLGLVEHQWNAGDYRQHELNHLFLASLAGITSTQAMPSSESHLEFLWARLAELTNHNLLPAPLSGIIQRHVQGEHGPVWVATFPAQ